VTADIVLLARGEPDNAVLVTALLAAGPDLRVGSIGNQVALQLFAEDGSLVTTVEVPSLIQVPNEAKRLLGVAEEPDPPYWWIELRTPSTRTAALAAALRLAEALAEQTDGILWRG
jgi:hypothetical protein